MEHQVFHPDKLVDRLARFTDVFPPVVRAFTPADTVWRPDPESWSVLEIVCHMADEEAEDFRTRVLMTLEDPTKDWPPINPAGWAAERDYQSKDLDTQLTRWITERHSSIKQLRALKNPDWTRTKQHPRFGPMIASDLLAAWCAHDALHLRQLAKRLHQLANRDAGPDSTTLYAGEW